MKLTRTEVLLIRHGETLWHKLGKLQGNFDIDLSSDGMIQAEYLAQKLDEKFDFIYSSPMKCAKKLQK
ncbi:histidine phosphatase family protein [Clostridium tyrobutyricum]|uniref:histidine phosphatase family protein n=1 Tax=Clostridium tyrobutyricum TaxID=1519 RepID=UPI000AAC185D|nr:histidine phosphatase family protein [Clostridium tyrobutyricum]